MASMPYWFVGYPVLNVLGCMYPRRSNNNNNNNDDDNNNNDDILSFSWLTKVDLSIESEGFLCAAQEQALSTRAMMQVYSQGWSAVQV